MFLEQRFPLLQQAFDIFLLDAESRSLTQSTRTYTITPPIAATDSGNR